MLYIIKSGEYLKVGFSNDVPKRMKQYATHNPNFEVLYIISGDEKLEKEIHRDLAHYHFKLEWFHYNDDVLARVNYLKEKYKDYVEDINTVKLRMRDIEYELCELMFNTSKDVNNIACTKYYKGKWAQQLKVPIKSIDSTITKLVKKKTLTKVTTSIYRLDETKLDKHFIINTLVEEPERHEFYI